MLAHEGVQGHRLVDREVAIGAMRNHRLTRLKMELGAIEIDRDDVRLERHQVGDAANLSVSVRVRPGRQTCLTVDRAGREPLGQSRTAVAGTLGVSRGR